MRLPPRLVPVGMRAQPLLSVEAVLSVVNARIVVPSSVSSPVKPARVAVRPGSEVEGIALVAVGARTAACLQIVVWHLLQSFPGTSLTWNTLPRADLRLVCLGIQLSIHELFKQGPTFFKAEVP